MYIAYITGLVTNETRDRILSSGNLSASWKYLYRSYRLAKRHDIGLRYRLFQLLPDGTKILRATMCAGHTKTTLNGFYPNSIDWTIEIK